MKKTLIALFMALSMVFMSSCCNNNVAVDGKWNIVSINGEAVTALENTPFIEFDTENGKVHGHTSCNIMNGTFTIKGDKLTFGDMATTMMAGPDMPVETAVLDAVKATASVKKSADEKLQILDKDGNVLMTLAKAE